MTDKEKNEESTSPEEKRKPGSKKFGEGRILSGDNQPKKEEQKKDKSSGSEFKDQ